MRRAASSPSLASSRCAKRSASSWPTMTRALVLWLAEHKQLPAVPKEKKEGYWAIDDIYYGYLHPSLFTYSAVPEAKGFSGSAEKHRFVSTCMDPQTAREIGLLGASTAACGCAECAQFNFSSCLMKGLGGMATQLGQFKTPRVGACAAAAGRRERSRSTTLR